MAFDIVNPQNLFLRSLGLEYLLLPDSSPDTLEGRKAETGEILTQGAPQKPVQRAARFDSSYHKTGAKLSSATKPEAKTSAQPARPAARTPAFTAAPFEEWPKIWQDQFKKTARGKLIWTYWQLGSDLLGLAGEDSEGRGQRSDFLRKVIQELAQPKGTHTFWPMALPDENGQYTANPVLFWSGVEALQCRAVVMLGSAAAVPLVPGKKLQPLDEFRLHGHMVWILRDIGPLLDSPTWYQMTLAFLKNAFHNHLRNW